MTPPVSVPPVVRLEDLRVGDLLAEGGEGRVHQLPRQPHLVYKSYRHPAERSHLEHLVSWPGTLESAEAASTVSASAAWPCSIVAGRRGEAVGLLMPRAPRRFSVRHKDGRSRLASLSYLTADPEHRAAAYGLRLPAAGGAERIGLVYALARLLAAFESGEPSVGHGDLSTKNVLWSLERGPEVFVIDCDNAERFGADGRPVAQVTRRRAMTPNWDDPAVPPGQNPSADTDRYSLGLVFLRVVGAANFPIQARQRGGGPVEVRFPVPPGPGLDVLLDPAATVWRLCTRSLSLSRPRARPPASAWLGVLEEVLDAMGASAVTREVWAAQGGGRPSPAASPAGEDPTDLHVVPERSHGRTRTWTRVSPAPRYGPGPQTGRPATIGYRWVPVGGGAPQPHGASAQSTPGWTAPPPVRSPGLPGDPAARVWPEVKSQLRRFLRWWLSIHRSVRRPPGRVRLVLLCLVVDLVMLVLGAAAVALIVSPIIQG